MCLIIKLLIKSLKGRDNCCFHFKIRLVYGNDNSGIYQNFYTDDINSPHIGNNFEYEEFDYIEIN